MRIVKNKGYKITKEQYENIVFDEEDGLYFIPHAKAIKCKMLTKEIVFPLLEKGWSYAKVCRNCNVSYYSFKRFLDKHKLEVDKLNIPTVKIRDRLKNKQVLTK